MHSFATSASLLLLLLAGKVAAQCLTLSLNNLESFRPSATATPTVNVPMLSISGDPANPTLGIDFTFSSPLQDELSAAAQHSCTSFGQDCYVSIKSILGGNGTEVSVGGPNPVTAGRGNRVVDVASIAYGLAVSAGEANLTQSGVHVPSTQVHEVLNSTSLSCFAVEGNGATGVPVVITPLLLNTTTLGGETPPATIQPTSSGGRGAKDIVYNISHDLLSKIQQVLSHNSGTCDTASAPNTTSSSGHGHANSSAASMILNTEAILVNEMTGNLLAGLQQLQLTSLHFKQESLNTALTAAQEFSYQLAATLNKNVTSAAANAAAIFGLVNALAKSKVVSGTVITLSHELLAGEVAGSA